MGIFFHNSSLAATLNRQEAFFCHPKNNFELFKRVKKIRQKNYYFLNWCANIGL